MIATPATSARPAGRWWLVVAVALPVAAFLVIAGRGYDGKPYLRGDCPYYYLAAVSLIEDGDLDLADQLARPELHSDYLALDRRDRLVPKHPIWLAVAALPLIALLGPPGALLFNLLQSALLVALLALLARRVASPLAAAVAVVATALGSFLPHYVWNFSPDLFASLLLLAAFAALPWGESEGDAAAGSAAPGRGGRYFAAGLLAGLAVISKFFYLFALPTLALLLPWRLREGRGRGWRAAALFGAGLAVPLALLGLLNLHLFGAPWVTSYDRIAFYQPAAAGGEAVAGGEAAAGEETSAGGAPTGRWVTKSQRDDFDRPFFTGLRDLLLDRDRGLAGSSAITLLAWLGLPLLARRRPRLALGLCLLFAALLVFFAPYRLWDRSHAGNRFLLPLVLLSALPLAALLDRGLVWWRQRRGEAASGRETGRGETGRGETGRGETASEGTGR